jgi:hypothetical protein
MPRPAFQRRVLLGGFAVAAVYAVVAVVEAIVTGRPTAAIPFAYTAVTIAGPLLVVSRMLVDRDGPGEDGSDSDDGPGPGGGGDDPDPQPWWPEFERQFWAHVETPPSGPPPRERPSVPA